MIEFVVNGNPRGKGRPKFTRQGNFVNTYTDKETASYENLVRLSYLEAKQEKYIGNEALSVSIKIFQQIPKSISKKKANEMVCGNIKPTKKPDPDNVIKAILDGLNGVAFRDDSQIVHLDCDKYYSYEPRVEVIIKEL